MTFGPTRLSTTWIKDFTFHLGDDSRSVTHSPLGHRGTRQSPGRSVVPTPKMNYLYLRLEGGRGRGWFCPRGITSSPFATYEGREIRGCPETPERTLEVGPGISGSVSSVRWCH